MKTRGHLCAVLAVGLAALFWAFPAQAEKPNFVVILADDFGYELVGADGGTSYATPNLDALAAGGMRFTRGYAQPLCTPTRVQLMTGLYNVRNYTQFGALDRGQTTFAHRLREAGYATGVFGKWQLGREPDSPRHFGFDRAVLWQHARRPPRYANPGLEFDGVEKDFANGEYGPDLVQAEALAFIRQNQDRPFLLYYTLMLTHAPWQPTPDSPGWDPKAKGEQVHDSPTNFADNVRYLDKLIGQVISALETNGLRKRTLVLFVGDNGTGAGITSRMGSRAVKGGKGQSTAAGMHVPFLASWPGVVGPGAVGTNLVDTTDVLPTLLEAAGVPLPTNAPCDGRSLLPLLRGQAGPAREWIYSWHPTRAREFAADLRFKLYADGRLVDWAADPLEATPVAPGSNAAAEAARKRLQTVHDQFARARPAALKAADGPGYQQGKGKKAARGSPSADE